MKKKIHPKVKKYHQYYLLNKEKIKDRVTNYYKENREARLKYHKKLYEINKKNPDFVKEKNERNRKSYPQRRDRILARCKERRAKIRIGLLKILGDNKCVRCGIDDVRVLQIDHIKGGGRREKREGYSTDNVGRYEKHILDNIQNYQILCANCNWIKELKTMKSNKKSRVHPAISAHFRKLAQKKWEKLKAQLIEKAEKSPKNKG